MAIDKEVKEKDIFDFVFNPSALEADLRKKIENGPEFKNRIEYYIEMKDELGIDFLANVGLSGNVSIPSKSSHNSIGT